MQDQRKDHTRSSLGESDLDPDPIRQFLAWFDQASHSGVAETNAMALATATPDGRPSVRMVLLRGVDAQGFAFFTNYESRKARELEANPHAALVFFWHELERQVRVEGRGPARLERRVRPIFPEPARRCPDRSLVLASERSHRQSSRPRGKVPRFRGTLQRRRCAPPGQLGRLPARGRLDRVLARA